MNEASYVALRHESPQELKCQVSIQHDISTGHTYCLAASCQNERLESTQDAAAEDFLFHTPKQLSFVQGTSKVARPFEKKIRTSLRFFGPWPVYLFFKPNISFWKLIAKYLQITPFHVFHEDSRNIPVSIVLVRERNKRTRILGLKLTATLMKRTISICFKEMSAEYRINIRVFQGRRLQGQGR
jgi:hypothetical protein